jgi:uncharacterized protein YjgD (DUF1641 family)
MSVDKIQAQLDEINRKLDLVMECALSQRQRSDAMEDLVADLSIVGKDAYRSSVELLEKHNVEIDPEELKILVIRVLKNLKNISMAFDAFESIIDFARDAAPLVNEIIIDFAKKLDQLDRKGYFNFIAAMSKVIDKVITHYNADELNKMADNILLLLDTLKSVSQPAVLNALANAADTYTGIEPQKIPSYSVFRLIREINSPEMKKVFGFMITFIKNYTQKNKNNHN